MNAQHVVALGRPCFEPGETSWPGFYRWAMGGRVSIGLTVNIGLE